jgi:hypothetical protein
LCSGELNPLGFLFPQPFLHDQEGVGGEDDGVEGGHLAMTTIRLQIPENALLNVAGHIYRSGDVFGAERDETVEQWLRAGTVEQVKVGRPKGSGRKASGKRSPGGTR